MKIDDTQDYTYVLVQWPETQVLMDYDWFDEEACLADFDKFGSSAYFIPQKRWLELHEDSSKNNLLSNTPLYYPSAREWMWNYCIYLGPFTDSRGNNYDLGCFISDYGYISNATVYGNEAGQYMSGYVYPKIDFDNEVVQEVLRRVKELKLIS